MMGMIIGKFKKRSAYEVIQKLENQITSTEEFRKRTEQFSKQKIEEFISSAVGLYLIFLIFLFCYYNKISSDLIFFYIILVLTIPIMIWIIKEFMTQYYSFKKQSNEIKLFKLKEEKILESVMIWY